MNNNGQKPPAAKHFQEASATLLNDTEKLSFFAERGISTETLKAAEIGYLKGAFTYPCLTKDGVLLGIHCKSEKRDRNGKRRQWWEQYADELPAKGRGKNPDNPAKVIPFGMETLKCLKPSSLVVLCCGEEDALSLRQAGYTALSQPGAGLLEPVYAKELAGFEVVLFYDAGEEQAANKDTLKLAEAGAQRVRVVRWPADAPNGADINERLVREPQSFKAWVSRMISSATLPHSLSTRNNHRDGEPDRYSGEGSSTTGQPLGRLLSQVTPERVSWLWPGRIPEGKLTVLDGDPGTGKSALTTDLAARVSKGSLLPDNTPCQAGGVVLLNAEDGLADTVRPRLEAADGDPTQVLALTTVGAGKDERLLRIPEDLELVREGIARVEARLVIIDPFMAFVSGKVNTHKDQDVRRVLAPLAATADETGAAIIIVRHLNQSTGQNALYRGGGSIGMIGQARSGLLVAEHPQDEELRVLAPLKNNLSKPVPSLTFKLVETDDNVVRVEYKGETSLRANALLVPPVEDRDELLGLRTAVVTLLKENTGSWEGTPTELHGTLGERDMTVLPDRADELTKFLKKIVRLSPIFSFSSGRRRDENKGVVRTLKLELREQHTREAPNGVHGGNGVHDTHDEQQIVHTVNAMNTDTVIGSSANGSAVQSPTMKDLATQELLALRCDHGYVHGKECFLCDPEHPYRTGAG